MSEESRKNNRLCALARVYRMQLNRYRRDGCSADEAHYLYDRFCRAFNTGWPSQAELDLDNALLRFSLLAGRNNGIRPIKTNEA